MHASIIFGFEQFFFVKHFVGLYVYYIFAITKFCNEKLFYLKMFFFVGDVCWLSHFINKYILPLLCIDRINIYIIHILCMKENPFLLRMRILIEFFNIFNIRTFGII